VKVLDLFSGIGGFSVGLEATGMQTVAFCEPDKYCHKVLKKNWPEVPIYDDVRELTADRLIRDGIRPDVIAGGFPCQDLSVAGQQAGLDGERSGLWSECARLLGEVRPRYAVFENVTNLLTGDGGDWFKRVLWDISEVGYDAEWHCIPASSVGAPHRRDRVWIVAYPNGDDGRGRDSTESHRGKARLELGGGGQRQFIQSADTDVAYTDSKRGCGRDSERQDAKDAWQSPIVTRKNARRVGAWDIEPDVGRVANGVPARSHRLKCLGNAVVPAIPQFIGECIWDSFG
tara:strand:- start:188 stop:1048 length:861 start_codon:yes stop_codon:yes gene_type:complete